MASSALFYAGLTTHAVLTQHSRELLVCAALAGLNAAQLIIFAATLGGSAGSGAVSLAVLCAVLQAASVLLTLHAHRGLGWWKFGRQAGRTATGGGGTGVGGSSAGRGAAPDVPSEILPLMQGAWMVSAAGARCAPAHRVRNLQRDIRLLDTSNSGDALGHAMLHSCPEPNTPHLSSPA